MLHFEVKKRRGNVKGKGREVKGGPKEDSKTEPY
jgi:hypothetical protein